jgi:hypothetical protein
MGRFKLLGAKQEEERLLEEKEKKVISPQLLQLRSD